MHVLAAIGQHPRELSRGVQPLMRVPDPIDVEMQDFPSRLPHAAPGQSIEAHEHDAIWCEASCGHREQSIPHAGRHPGINAVRNDVVEGAMRRRKRGQVLFDQRHIRKPEFGDHPAPGLHRARRQIATDELRHGKPHGHRNQVRPIVAADLEDTACRNRRRVDAQERCDRGQPVGMGQRMR